MAENFLGELKLVSFNFPPRGWALCNGQFLSIAQNQALFSLLGTMYGGNGVTTFALPDLRGRTAMHVSSGLLGERDGLEAVALAATQMPAHTHALNGTSDLANASVPGGALPGAKARGGLTRYGPADGSVPMGASALAPAGGGQPHENMQPFTVLNWVIAITGIFPSRD